MKEAMFSYPVQLRVKGRRCAVVGAGSVAYRKAKGLAAQGADVTVIAPECCPDVQALICRQQVKWIADRYRPEYIDGAFLVFAATDSDAVNRQVVEDAPGLVSSATAPETGDFSLPAVCRKGPVAFTVSAGGHAGYARLLKSWLMKRFPEEAAAFGAYLLDVRQRLLETKSTPKERTAFWRNVLNDELMDLLERHRIEEAREQIEHAVDCFRTESSNRSR